jgi:hypothetical protein
MEATTPQRAPGTSFSLVPLPNCCGVSLYHLSSPAQKYWQLSSKLTEQHLNFNSLPHLFYPSMLFRLFCVWFRLSTCGNFRDGQPQHVSTPNVVSPVALMFVVLLLLCVDKAGDF